MKLENFLTSGFEFSNEEYELRLHYYLYNSILLIVIVMFSILILLRIIGENYLQAVVDFIVVLLASGGIYYLRKSRQYENIISIILLVAFFVMISFSFFNVSIYIGGASWYIAFLLPAFFLSGRRRGVAVALLSFVIVIILGTIAENNYTLFEYFYVLMPFVMSVAFIMIYEKRNSTAKELLYEKNISLEREVELKTQEQIKLLERSRELANMVEASSIELYIVDFETDCYLYVNNGALDVLGYTFEEMMGMSIYDVNPTLTNEELNGLKDSLVSTTKNVVNVTKHQKKDGSTYGVQSFIHTITYGGIPAYVIYDIDITERQKAQTELLRQKEMYTRQAHYDTLTKLPNRTLFNDRLRQAISKSKRSKKDVAVFFIDLDQFKQINDSLGHKVGDEVLAEVALRFKAVLREEDTLARLGGDEFTVIIEHLASPESAAVLAQKLITSIHKPMVIGGHELFLSCSIGISIYPKDAQEATLLLGNADAAMYHAKEDGRNTFNFYTTDMTENAFERVVMEAGLRRAIEKNEFVVFYQPQYNALHDKIVGMEGLIRWEHPDLGEILPEKFIPLAEENGMIIEIDRLVMKRAMKQVGMWHKEGLDPGKVSLNLSIKQLGKDDFFDVVVSMLKATQCRPEWLKFEVTEGQVMKNPEKAIDILGRISALGIELAVDDFGTGYSSLSYLKRLPIDQLKIDQSFIHDIPNDDEDAAITKAVVALAKSLKLHVIAEGVENKEQKEFLLANGCVEMQGYLFSKPIPANEIYQLLKKI